MAGIPKQLIYITVGFLFIGVFPQPYGYYMVLRFIAFAVFAWAAFVTFNRNENISPWVFAILAVVFNPFIKVHFPKELWAIIDFGSGLFLVLMRDKIQDKKST